MLPSACRHFPRVFLRDGRGLLLTLSHFCPTSAALLMDAGPVEVVDAPSALMLAEPIEGLDARDALPPLVRPGLLADIEGYDAWEGAVVQTFVQSPDAESAFARIERATEGIRRWKPGGEPLAAVVHEAFAMADADGRDDAPLSKPFEIVRELTGPHPLMEVPAGFPRAWALIRRDDSARMAATIGRYLAASAFGNWIAYRGQGLRSVVAWLRASYDVLRVQLVRGGSQRDPDVPLDLLEPIRMADYIMVHTVDSLAFGRAAAVLER
jgi:hypothetical protein